MRAATPLVDAAAGAAAPVASPCVSVCAMDARTGLCSGCLRTIDEIAAWSRFSDDEKRVVWRQIAERRARA